MASETGQRILLPVQPYIRSVQQRWVSSAAGTQSGGGTVPGAC